MERNTSLSSGGSGATLMLFAAFLILKLMGITPFVDWPWWLVCTPIWGSLALVLIILLLASPFIIWVARK